jgi:DNA repair protein RecN (Recombination protein N)
VLAAVAARVADAGHLLTDVAADLASYVADVDADPLRLATAQERLALLTTLTRRYAVEDADGVLAWAADAAERLVEVEGDDERIAALKGEDAALEIALGAVAAELSRARKVAAEQFGAAVTAELVELAMPHAQVAAEVSQRESPDGLVVDGRRLAAGPDGVDDVELLLVPHPGAPARALQKGASGGELSRVMLAVEVVFAGADRLGGRDRPADARPEGRARRGGRGAGTDLRRGRRRCRRPRGRRGRPPVGAPCP